MDKQQGCGACSRESENKNFDCPPRMADGRMFTDYRPRCDANLEWQAPMSGTHEYRQFLIHNADALMGHQRDAAFTKAFCGPCVEPYDQGTVLPDSETVACDKVGCKRSPTRAGSAGLGTGRDYGMLPSNKAALDAFLAQQATNQSELTNGKDCCACANGGDGYYPMPGYNVVGGRSAVPSGATPIADGGDRRCR